MIEARTFLHALRGGSSLPLVFVADDDQRYVVRMRGAGDGALGLIVDWLGLGLARLFALPAPSPVPLLVSAALPLPTIDPEYRELIERSVGINLATPYAADATSLAATDVGHCERELRRRIFLLDVLLMNIDRTRSNPNLLLIGGALTVQDFDSAMALRLLVAGKVETDAVACLQELRRHVLFDDAWLDPGAPLLPGLDRAALAALVSSVPDEWWQALLQHHGHRIDDMQFVADLDALVHDHGSLRRRLSQLAELPAVSEDEWRTRRQANSQALRARLQR